VAAPDFERNVYCLLGLPFDAVDLARAEALLRQSIATKTRCFLSTPNLNFLIACQRDPAFRLSVITSNLVVADGMPIVWLAKLLGIPITQRVAGSTLFERLRASASDESIRTYFFGGQDGIAQQASQRMNAQTIAMQCVGYTSPGFGSIEAMSTPSVIAEINASEADFLVVSLGARKGQAWIVRNLSSLTAPVVSHLGAVVNFVAGNIRRAPAAFQALGLEWLWRIKEEPQLWRRYFDDGLGLLGLLVNKVLPSLWTRHITQKATDAGKPATIDLELENGSPCIVLAGAWSAANLQAYRTALQRVSEHNTDVRINLGRVSHVDSAFLGLTLLLYGHQTQTQHRLILEDTPAAVQKIIRQAGMGFVLAA